MGGGRISHTKLGVDGHVLENKLAFIIKPTHSIPRVVPGVQHKRAGTFMRVFFPTAKVQNNLNGCRWQSGEINQVPFTQ